MAAPAGQDLTGLPHHVEDGDGDLLLHLVQEVVGGVAGHRDGGASPLLQQLGAVQQAVVHRVLLPGQDRRRAVGDLVVGENQHGDMLLIGAGRRAVDDILVKGVGGLGAHAAQNAETVI